MSSVLPTVIHNHNDPPFSLSNLPPFKDNPTTHPSRGWTNRDSCTGLPTPPLVPNMPSSSLVDNLSVHPSAGSYATGHAYSTNDYQPSAATIEYHSSRNTSHADFDFTQVPESEKRKTATRLHIPHTVIDTKLSLSDLAAQMTCFFWFESSDMLSLAETQSYPLRALTPDATPTSSFRKWVASILNTTQVGKNVVLLALMFIHRLRKFNPTVSGKRGSECRLLTIALMLGNKFLDDNTYTNKTWAEVSRIPVGEIHIMEVEFLSNMRYELYASAEQWQEWKQKLTKLTHFYDSAMELITPTQPILPSMPLIPAKLPSPPNNGKHLNRWPVLPHPLNTVSRLPRSPVGQVAGPSHGNGRKRSLDIAYDLPSAKRLQQATSVGVYSSPVVLTPASAFTPDSALTTTSHDSGYYSQLSSTPSAVNYDRPLPQLAPLTVPHTRSMSSVYAGSMHPHIVPPATAPGIYQPQMHTVPQAYSTVSKSDGYLGSAHTSPINFYGTSTPTKLSPSQYLLHRSSPYRPVRHVNTLLYPPSSSAMQGSIGNFDSQQIQYQPLSKTTSQYYTGPMPRLQPDPWYHQVSTPISAAYQYYQ